MALDAEAAPAAELALSDTDINWSRLDKTKFHIIGATLFTAQSALLHPTAVVKTRMQVAGSGKQRMLRLAELVPRHPGRTKKQEPASSSAAGSSKSGKGGRRKK